MVVSIAIRLFQWADLEEFTSLVNDVDGIASTERAFTPEYMREWLGQPFCKPEENCYLAEAGGKMAGYSLIAPEVAISRTVASGGVLESFQRQGIGERLLERVLERSRELGVSLVHVQASDGNPAAQALLSSEGFNAVRYYWQMRWEGGQVPSFQLPQGFSLRFYQPGEDDQALTEVQNASFGQNWGFCPNTVEEIAYRARMRGFRPEGIIFVVHDERVASYNWTRIDSNSTRSTGVVYMTGVHPDYRGQGVGRGVLLAGMDYLFKQGVQRIELEVDQDNSPARDIYLSVGFRRVGELVWYEKRLAF